MGARMLSLAGALALALSAPAMAQESPAAVTVAGSPPITEADIARWVDIARASSGGTGEQRELEQQAVQLLVSFKWIEGESAERGIVVTDHEVKKSFEEQKAQSFPSEADYQQFLAQSHETEADILARVRWDLLSNEIRDRVQRPIRVSRAEVDAYIRKHEAPMLPERRDVKFVVKRTLAQARQALRAIKRGRPWKSVGGEFINDFQQGLDEDEERPALARASFAAPLKQIVGPVKLDGDYTVFQVVRVKPKGRMPAGEYRADVRQTLLTQAQQKALTAFVKAFTAKWRARTTCAPAFTWAKDCANHVQPSAQPRPGGKNGADLRAPR